MLRLENLSKSFYEKTILYKESYHFPEGERIALVGDNGSGKTTLLNMITGALPPDGGSIILPQNIKIGFLPQEPNPNPQPTIVEECESANRAICSLKKKMDELLKSSEQNERDAAKYTEAEAQYRTLGGYELRAKAEKTLVGLGFRGMMQRSPKELSGGWRMRIELAKLFLMNPEVLILDEPTNHLDLPSLVWVEKYLQTYPGTLIFVSHDRALLNRLATITLAIHDGHLREHKGNYDDFLRFEKEALALAERTRKNLEKKKEDLETFIARFGAKATKAAQAHSKQKMVDEIDRELELLPKEELHKRLSFKLPSPPPNNRVVYKIEKGSIGYKAPLSSSIDLQILAGMKMGVIGANGLGKSTLLKTMAGKIPSLGGVFQKSEKSLLSFFAQDQLESFSQSQTILDAVLSHSSQISEKEARSLLGNFLFSGDDIQKKIGVLSGGEKSRVGLASLISQRANVLFLDEPTNHLDMESIVALKRALASFEGTIVFVSHDRDFIDAMATHLFVMAEGGLHELFEGKLEDYERLAPQRGFPNVFEVETPSAKKVEAKGGMRTFSERKEEQRAVEKKAKRKAVLEQRMKDLEVNIQTIDEKLADTSDHLLCQKLGEERLVLTENLQKAEEEWLSL